MKPKRHITATLCVCVQYKKILPMGFRDLLQKRIAGILKLITADGQAFNKSKLISPKGTSTPLRDVRGHYERNPPMGFRLVEGGGSRVVVSTAAFHARVRGSIPGLGGFKETKMFPPHPRVKVSIVGSLRDREVACSASDRQGSNFESCVWRKVSSHSSHHPQEVLQAQFSLYVHKGGLKPDSFHLFSD